MMATRLSTPPSAKGISTPSAPKHGFEDSWAPYPTRHSSRVSSQRAQKSAKTPSPNSPNYNLREQQVSPSLALPRGTSSSFTRNIESPGITVAKKRNARSSLGGDSRRVSGTLSEEGAKSAAAALGITSTKGESNMASNPIPSTLRKGSMLPTPAKTPKKRPEKPGDPQLASISRTLFDVRPQTIDEVFPTPKRGRGKYTDTLLEYDTDQNAPIKIHVDSRERVPELDLSADNGFDVQRRKALPDPVKKNLRKIMVNIPGEGEVPLEEALKRDDGIVSTFRGKHMWRKLTVGDDEDDLEPAGSMLGDTLSAELDATVPTRLRGPLTRSSLKPRLLFPTAEQLAVRETQHSEIVSDEEATTDIEERNSEVSTPYKQMDECIITPTAPRFAPVSPPTTVRTTRSSKKLDEAISSDTEMTFGGDGAGDEPPRQAIRVKSLSPFDAWQRTKARYGSPTYGRKHQSDSTHGRKRRGSPTLGGESNKVSKRHRDVTGSEAI